MLVSHTSLSVDGDRWQYGSHVKTCWIMVLFSRFGAIVWESVGRSCPLNCPKNQPSKPILILRLYHIVTAETHVHFRYNLSTSQFRSMTNHCLQSDPAKRCRTFTPERVKRPHRKEGAEDCWVAGEEEGHACREIRKDQRGCQ